MKSLKYYHLFFLLLFSFSAFSQNRFDLQGQVVDSLQQPLGSATVMLMNQNDSVMVNFGLSHQDGSFLIKKIAEGNYLLQITYIGYENHIQQLTINKDAGDINVGQIVLKTVVSNLKEVTVMGEHIPLRMNKDTLEYNANAFQTRPGSVVEDLLKKLPGVEVDREGNIRAQGEQVRQVMVDGKEFFGNDPKIATKNLPANAVDKVQVFDKKSDFAEFSGIDDGNEQKTINLELKEGKKKGYFGNITAAYGTEERYRGKFNLNRFGKKAQTSLIGMANNINEQGFSINDYINFMGGLGNLMSGGGGAIRINAGDIGLPLSLLNQNGITTTWAGGANLNYDWNKKTELSASYFYNKMDNVTKRSVNQQNLLTDNAFFDSKEEEEEVSGNHNHRLNLSVQHEIDSFQNLIFRTNIGYTQSNLMNLENSQTFNPESILENSGTSDYLSNTDNYNLNSSLTYRLRFQKIGRLLSLRASLIQSNNEAVALLDAINTFPTQNLIDTVAQRQLQENKTTNWGGSISYTEPLGRGKYLEFNYARQNYNNSLLKEFYDRSSKGNQKQEIFNTELSRHFDQDYIYNRSGLNLRWNKKKLQLMTGLSWQHSQLKAALLSENLELDKAFRNWLPTMRLDYELSGSSNLNFSYRTSVREPSLQQLQPVVDNSNPLRIYEGNPNLEVEYAHNFDFGFLKVNQFAFTNFFLNLSGTYTQNKITNAQTIDGQFRQILQPVNVTNDFVGRAYISLGTPLKFIKSRLNFNPNFGFNRGISFVNALENTFNRFTPSVDFSLENRKKEIMDWMIGADLSLTSTTYSENQEFNQSFLNQTYYIDYSIDFAKTWAFSSTLDYQIYSDVAFGEREVVPLWQAAITKFVFHNKGQIKLSVYDILNQNLGVNRTSNLNYIREERVVSLGRYFMLTLGWSLSGFNNQGGNGGFEVRMRR